MKRLVALLLAALAAGPALALGLPEAPPAVPAALGDDARAEGARAPGEVAVADPVGELRRCVPEAPDPADPDLVVPADDAVRCSQDAFVASTGEDLWREDVRIDMEMDFRNLDIDLVGVLFGGGKFDASVRLATRIEFRALSVGRIQEAIAEATSGAANLSELGVNTSRQYLAADEFRLLLAGEALAAFEDEQERRLAEFLAGSFPELTVLSTRFEWSNTDPIVNARGATTQDALTNLQEPPLVVEAVVDFQYLDRKSLVDLLDAWRSRGDDPAAPAPEDDPRAALLRRVREENEGAFYERSAFSVLGITQLLVLRMEPGWDLAVGMHLPQGYTFEYASPDVLVEDGRRVASVETLARGSPTPVENPAAVSLSNRFLVTVAILVVVLAAGAALRFPALLLANRVRARSAPGTGLVKRLRAAFKGRDG